MLTRTQNLTNPLLLTIINKNLPYYLLSRFKKQPILPQSHNSERHRNNTIRRLLSSCKDQNKQQATELLDRQFYNKLYNKQHLAQCLDWKNSVQYYFRDYEAIKMNLQNLRLLMNSTDKNNNTDGGYVYQNLLFIKKSLIQILSNHKDLAKTYRIFTKNSNKKSFMSIYISSLCGLVLGQSQQSQKSLLQILNSPFQDMLKSSSQQIKILQKQQSLLYVDRNNPSSLNFKQQVLFNLLNFNMYRDVQFQRQKIGRNQPLSLYGKIRDGKKIQMGELALTDYQEFLNIWVSAKYDAPMQWNDLTQQQKYPYHRYIYLLAQNSYIRKQIPKSTKILSQLPTQHPLRYFLTCSRLFDQKNYKQLQTTFDSMDQQIRNRTNPFFKMPEFDIIHYNIIQIMMRMQNKLAKVDNTKEKQEKEELMLQLQQEQTVFKYVRNIVDLQSKGIPFYYLDFPFRDFLVNGAFLSIFR